jgi:hypothetical protein
MRMLFAIIMSNFHKGFLKYETALYLSTTINPTKFVELKI